MRVGGAVQESILQARARVRHRVTVGFPRLERRLREEVLLAPPPVASRLPSGGDGGGGGRWWFHRWLTLCCDCELLIEGSRPQMEPIDNLTPLTPTCECDQCAPFVEIENYYFFTFIVLSRIFY